ncbi:hypothetical protein PYCC9005_001568 [Savitreella phatthalungensis]
MSVPTPQPKSLSGAAEQAVKQSPSPTEPTKSTPANDPNLTRSTGKFTGNFISPYLDADKCNTWPNINVLKDRVVVITGGASGFGRAFALKYLEAGCRVIIGDLDTVKGEALAKSHPRASFVKCNVLSWNDQVKLFETAMSYGAIDIVIANAGVTEGKYCETILEFKEPPLRCLDINLRAQFFTAKLAHIFFAKTQNKTRKNLILLGSMASVGEIPGGPEYTAAKHGMLGLMRALRRTSPQEGAGACRVNSLHPWFVETGIIDVREKALLAGTVYSRIEDVVKAALVISCDDTINGRALAVLEPAIGVIDIGVEGREDCKLVLSEAGDFGIFTRRIEYLYGVRSKAIRFVTYLESIIKVTKPLRIPAIFLALFIAFKRSSRLQMLWLVLQQRIRG